MMLGVTCVSPSVVPVQVPAVKCLAPAWPQVPDLNACLAEPDPDTCAFRAIGSWIRAAERYHQALEECPSVREVPVDRVDTEDVAQQPVIQA